MSGIDDVKISFTPKDFSELEARGEAPGGIVKATLVRVGDRTTTEYGDRYPSDITVGGGEKYTYWFRESEVRMIKRGMKDRAMVNEGGLPLVLTLVDYVPTKGKNAGTQIKRINVALG